MQTVKFRLKIFSIFTSILLISGCATIPSEAPQLSGELGKRISAIERSNITLLHKFFDLKRNEVDKFIEKEWTPIFAKNFFSEPKIQKMWETIVTENNPADRLKFLIITGPKLQKKINRKRLQLIKPLDKLERFIERRIRTEFRQARSINNSITSFLISASKVEENRNRYLNMIGITDNKIGALIDGVDETVGSLIDKSKDIKSYSEKYIKKLNDLKNIIK
ncbi:MAG: hypothetical protein IIB83_02485 [Bacteroidetes bacterium]|nr:hypothetical protein [Bacteroidota bacterium]